MDDAPVEAPVKSPSQQSPARGASREPSVRSQTEQSIKSQNEQAAGATTEVNRMSSVGNEGQELAAPTEAPLRISSPPQPSSPAPGTPQKSPKSASPPPKSPSLSVKSPSLPHPTSPVRSVSPGSVAKGSILSNKVTSKTPSVDDKTNTHKKSEHIEENIVETLTNLEPQGKSISDHVDELTETVKKLSKSVENPQTPVLGSNIDKIAEMSKILTNEANALRASIRGLSQDIARTKQELDPHKEDVNFPYHLFLIELIINKIHMKCDCFELDCNNLVISATFLGKQPIILYDQSYGKIDNFNKLNVGKSTLFAMTYDKICSIREFEIVLNLSKQPPCSSCVTKIGETHMDYTKEFSELREELCLKWCEEQPKDNIVCTTSTPLSKNMYYIKCGNNDDHDTIGIIEVTTRMSFLGKEITTAFSAAPKPQGTSFLLKEDNGMTMYSCQKVEMDDQGKILLDEDTMTNKPMPKPPPRRLNSPMSQESTLQTYNRRPPERYANPQYHGEMSRYDEILTKMNENELKIRVPKSTKVERIGKYDKIQELCSCEETPYNTGDQIQFEMPSDNTYSKNNTYSSNLKYTYRGYDRPNDNKDRRVINVTPTNCPVPVDMEKMMHPQKDVFILKIGKKLETKDKKTDLEIELVTPKVPSEKPAINNHISQQCSSTEVKEKPSKTDSKKKGKGKGKAKAKGGKAKKKKGKK